MLFPGASVCVACDAGTFSNQSGSADCTICGHGSYSEEASTECTLCLPGKYLDTAGLFWIGCVSTGYS